MKYGFRPVVSRLHFSIPTPFCHDDFVPMSCAYAVENARIAAAIRTNGNVRVIMECPPSYPTGFSSMAVVRTSIPELGDEAVPLGRMAEHGVVRVALLDAKGLPPGKEPSHPNIQSEPPHTEQVAKPEHDVERAPHILAQIRVILIHLRRECRVANFVRDSVQPVSMVDKVDGDVRRRPKAGPRVGKPRRTSLHSTAVRSGGTRGSCCPPGCRRRSRTHSPG